ncbi:MAG TPA: hypothetical protein VGS57_07000 [Thermoanaerobaculia bacterium]|jgi:hypothetical protein|nr:hypothetical protein [Thermoanaerobaculia bacterium]
MGTEQSATLTSPAKRLLKVYERARLVEVARGASGQDFWASVLGVEDVSRTFEMLGLIHALFAATFFDLRASGLEHYIPKLEQLQIGSLGPASLANPWPHLRERIDEAGMVTLRAASDLLTPRSNEIEVSEETLAELRSEVIAVLERIRSDKEAGKVSVELAERLTHHLQRALDALDRYPLEGAIVLRATADAGLSEVVLHHSEHQSPAERSEGVVGWQRLVGKFFKASAPFLTQQLVAGAVQGATKALVETLMLG